MINHRKATTIGGFFSSILLVAGKDRMPNRHIVTAHRLINKS
jgi:hypothetical protein